MQRKLLAIAIMLLGAAALAAVVLRDPLGLRMFGNVAALAVTVGALLVVVGVAMFTTAMHDPNSPTWLRLDHFLPFLRKKKKAETLRPPTLLVRIAQRVLPASLFADRITGKPGLARRLLKRIGPTMLSAPLRRVVQAICFVLFLWLFFYALWPYSARPESPGQIAGGWRLNEIDATGNVQLAGGTLQDWQPAARASVHLIDDRALDAIRGDFGAFNVIALKSNQITLAPRESLGDEQIEALLTSVGTWSIHEKSPWPSHYADHLAQKEFVPAESFLVIDPLVSLSTAIASRSWVWSLACAAMILLVCVFIPRGFCGYLCPLGTLIDLFDWAIGKRVTRFRVADDGWWVHIKYYLLAGVLLWPRVRRAGLGLRRGDPGHHARPAVPWSSRCRRGSLRGLAPRAADERRALRFDRAVLRRARPGLSEAAVLVQVRLPERRGVFARQSVSRHRAQGRKTRASTATSASRSARSTRSSPTSPRAPPTARSARPAAASARRRRSSSSSAGISSS